MSRELECLAERTVSGKLDRGAFMGRAAALGVSAAVGNSLLSTSVLATAPGNGGYLKTELQGGESTNSLDPASFETEVPIDFGNTWGETIVRYLPRERSSTVFPKASRSRQTPRPGTSRFARVSNFTMAKP
jgi:peptide/nickel transport system substrate-binding protein